MESLKNWTMKNKTKKPPIEKGGNKKKKILLWCAIVIVVFYAIIAIAPSEPQKKLTYTERAIYEDFTNN